MYIRSLGILLLIFVCNCLPAQPLIDSLRLFNKISSFELLDAGQQKKARLDIDGKPLSLFIFLSPECPLCQNYTKTINGLSKKFGPQLNLFGIVPGNAYTAKEVTGFANKYQATFPIFIDKKQQLTHYLKATVTPQAILLDNQGNLVYSGAIDDWVQGLGKKRLNVNEHYVQDAIEQSLKPELVKIKTTKAFGCKINDY
ncbi:MAG: redoxin domain-containing protein [Ferruginibacter sp.]